ncbi:MAG TPA: M14 family zinc carboxypeptidase [Thermoanaerobaculia bacterium]|nr:M14 family zinc carboxypeptidase [Thermoanaerobaculia bacterium]
MLSSPVSLPIEDILASEAPPPLRSIGRSREGREILGTVLGSGSLHVSLIGGCHSDEPVGPAMLRRLVSHLAEDVSLLARYTWYVVPHVNPDGEARNAAWSDHTLPEGEDRVFDLPLYLRHAMREKPGDDMEFGFPRGPDDLSEGGGARPENRAVAGFLAGGAPFAVHGSFHSIAFAPGPWFLIEPAWVDRTGDMRRRLRERVRSLGYGLFDVDRGGEKGFRRIDEGFSTRPDSRSMIAWFEERGDPETAAKFRPSSMEYVRSLGGDPFTFVSEMPLFLRPLPEGDTGRPDDPVFRAWLERVGFGQTAGVRGMPLRDQMRLQLAFLEEALRTVGKG